MIPHEKIKNSTEPEFAVFCIENVAAKPGVNAERVYQAFTEKSDILNGCIVPEHEVLHTRSRKYIVDDLLIDFFLTLHYTKQYKQYKGSDLILLHLDFGSDIPIYVQIRNQIVLGIADGGLEEGERLPTIRALADECGINMMTVSKAYQLLKQEGYIRTDRRLGTVVCGISSGSAPKKETLDGLRLHLSELRMLGIDKEEALKICSRLYGEGTTG